MIFPFLTCCYLRIAQVQSEPAAPCSALKELADGAACLWYTAYFIIVLLVLPKQFIQVLYAGEWRSREEEKSKKGWTGASLRILKFLIKDNIRLIGATALTWQVVLFANIKIETHICKIRHTVSYFLTEYSQVDVAINCRARRVHSASLGWPGWKQRSLGFPRLIPVWTSP